MKFNQIVNEVLSKDHPRFARKSWKNKKIELDFPNSIKTVVLDDDNNIIDTTPSYTEEDLSASDWEVTD